MGPIFDNRLRPVIEFIPATVLVGLAVVLLHDPALFFPLLPGLAEVTAAGFGTLGLVRAWQGYRLVRYRRQLRRLPRYVLPAKRIPLSRHKLFLGRGFPWDQRHSQRLVEVRSPQARRWLEPGVFYRAARAFELRFEHCSPHPWGSPSGPCYARPKSLPAILSGLLGWLTRLTRTDAWWNPVRPLPPLGGDPALHGVGLEDERAIWMDLGDRVGQYKSRNGRSGQLRGELTWDASERPDSTSAMGSGISTNKSEVSAFARALEKTISQRRKNTSQRKRRKSGKRLSTE